MLVVMVMMITSGCGVLVVRYDGDDDDVNIGDVYLMVVADEKM